MPSIERACVAAGHPLTAEAGAEILRAGGNAVDAACAAAAMSFIAEPVLTGAGGGGFMLIYLPNGKAILLDGFARMPGARIESVPEPDFRAIPVDFGDTVQTFHIGRASVATPGLMKLLFEANRRLGRMPMREVLAPAMAAAREGVRLNALQARFMRLLSPILEAEPESRRLHAPSGGLPGPGDRFRNPELSAMLELLALDGVDEMYRGDLARAIVNAIEMRGPLTMRDMEDVDARPRSPLRVRLFGGELLTNPPPSAGGTLIAFSLRLFEELRAAERSEPAAILLAETMRAAGALRAKILSARPSGAAPLDDTELMKWLSYIIQHLDKKDVSGPENEPSDRNGSTTHISVLDRSGMAVSLTASNGEGSGIVVPGTGIHLNNMLGEEDINPDGFHRLPPAATLPSMMAPSLLLLDGRPAMILGSGGSNRLRGAIMQALLRHVVENAPVDAAVTAPRLHFENRVLDAEPGSLGEAEAAMARALGWRVRHWRESSVYFGGVHAIAVDAGGHVSAAGDPRRGGAVAWA